MTAGGRASKLAGMTTLQLHQHLRALSAERAAVSLIGLDDESYLRDLAEEIEATHHAYVGAAVTEIASFRAQLDGSHAR